MPVVTVQMPALPLIVEQAVAVTKVDLARDPKHGRSFAWRKTIGISQTTLGWDA